MKRHLIALALLLPTATWAVGADDDDPPVPTETTAECADGMVRDAETKTCMTPKDARLDDDTRYRAAREFAYAGRFDAALGALRAISDPGDDRVLTNLGFVHRNTGRHRARDGIPPGGAGPESR